MERVLKKLKELKTPNTLLTDFENIKKTKTSDKVPITAHNHIRIIHGETTLKYRKCKICNRVLPYDLIISHLNILHDITLPEKEIEVIDIDEIVQEKTEEKMVLEMIEVECEFPTIEMVLEVGVKGVGKKRKREEEEEREVKKKFKQFDALSVVTLAKKKEKKESVMEVLTKRLNGGMILGYDHDVFTKGGIVLDMERKKKNFPIEFHENHLSHPSQPTVTFCEIGKAPKIVEKILPKPKSPPPIFPDTKSLSKQSPMTNMKNYMYTTAHQIKDMNTIKSAEQKSPMLRPMPIMVNQQGHLRPHRYMYSTPITQDHHSSMYSTTDTSRNIIPPSTYTWNSANATAMGMRPQPTYKIPSGHQPAYQTAQNWTTQGRIQ